MGDPDNEILCIGLECFAEGVPLGCLAPVEHVAQVFPLRTTYRKLDESVLMRSFGMCMCGKGPREVRST